MKTINAVAALLFGALAACVQPTPPCECPERDAGAQCGTDAGPVDAGADGGSTAQDAPYSLRYELQLDTADASVTLAALPTVWQFRGASGLEPYDHALPFDVKGGPDGGRARGEGWTELHLVGSDGPGFAALRQWGAELSKVAVCADDGTPCDGEQRWKQGAPPFLLTGRVLVRTLDSEVVLGKYTFHEAWPVSRLGVETGDGGVAQVVSLTLATRMGTLEYNVDHPLIAGLKSAYPTGRFDPAQLDLTGSDLRLGRPEGLGSMEASLDEAWAAPSLRAVKKVHAHNGDYLPAHNFKLEIDGVISGGFKEVTGLEPELEVIEYKDSLDAIVHKRPGRAKFKNLVLKRGQDPGRVLKGNFNSFPRGAKPRRSGAVISLDRNGQQVLRYNFFEAWPCRWKAPELNSNSDTFIVEELELAVDYIERG
ncbi:MAG: phage tail protein [Myxococcaceae bacterium]|nr:phage tail protein [Myxococcaceae bacterium]